MQNNWDPAVVSTEIAASRPIIQIKTIMSRACCCLEPEHSKSEMVAWVA